MQGGCAMGPWGHKDNQEGQLSQLALLQPQQQQQGRALIKGARGVEQGGGGVGSDDDHPLGPIVVIVVVATP
jgi:hypothetical protein